MQKINELIFYNNTTFLKILIILLQFFKIVYTFWKNYVKISLNW